MSALWGGEVCAQDTAPAGTVTSLTGKATLTHVSTPQSSLPLKFKDRVLFGDKISTGEESIVKVLMGGKALLTIRELSVFTVTESAGRSTVDIESGRIALSIVKSKMKPGETIEVKTPNAIAAVRGTVFFVELSGLIASFYVLNGAIQVSAIETPSAPVTVSGYQSVTVSGNQVGQVQNLSPQAATQMFKTILSTPPQHTDLSAEAQQQVSVKEAAKGAALANVLSPNLPTGQQGPTTTQAIAPVVSTTEVSGEAETVVEQLITPPAPPPPADAPNVSLSGVVTVGPGEPVTTVGPGQTFGETLSTFQENLNRSGVSPVVQVQPGAQVTQVLPPATPPVVGNLLQIDPGVNVTLAGSLMEVTNANLTAGTNVLSVQGSLTSTSSTPVLMLDPTTTTAPGDLVQVTGPAPGGTLTTASALLSDIGGTITIGGSLLAISGGGAVHSTTAAALFEFDGSTTTAGHLLVQDQSSLTLSGSLARASGGSLTVTGAAVEVTNPTVPLNFGMQPIVTLQDGATFATTAGPFAKITGGALTADALVQTDGAGNQLTLSGGLLSGANATISLRELVDVSTGGTDTSAYTGVPAGGLIHLSDTNLTVQAGRLLERTGPAGPGNLNGPLLVATGGQVSSGSTVIVVGNGTLTSSATLPLISLQNTPLETSNLGGLLGITTGGNLALSGGLVSAQGSAVTVDLDAITILGGGQLTSTTSSALISLSSSPLTLPNFGSLLTICCDGAGAANLAGSLLDATASAMTIDGDAVSVANAGSLTSTGTNSLIQVSGGSLSMNNRLQEPFPIPEFLTPWVVRGSGTLSERFLTPLTLGI